MRYLSVVAVFVLLIALTASCAPGAVSGAQPAVIVINGPQDARIPVAAPSLVAAMDELGTPGYRVVRNVAIESVERSRNLFGSQAVPSAARIGRNFGADYVLMLGTAHVEREVLEARGDQVRVIMSLSVEGDLVRAGDEQVVASVESRVFTGERIALAADPLPELRRDPLAEELASVAAASLAPTFHEIIATSVNGSSSE